MFIILATSQFVVANGISPIGRHADGSVHMVRRGATAPSGGRLTARLTNSLPQLSCCRRMSQEVAALSQRRRRMARNTSKLTSRLVAQSALRILIMGHRH